MKKKAGFRQAHALGQNFLDDPALLQRLVDIAGVTAEDAVFEVGSGMGDLSRLLALRARKLVTVEVDGRLIPFVRLKLDGMDHAQVLHADAETMDMDAVLAALAPVRVVGNLPYHLTTALMEKFLRAACPVRSISVMVQKEAARRIAARPGEEGWGPLAVLARMKTAPEERLFVPRTLFTPPPNVDSAFVHLPALERPRVEERHQPAFLRLVRACFANRRKTLLNNLMPYCGMGRQEAEALLSRLGFGPTLRAEQMDIGDFEALRAALEERKAGAALQGKG